ncbi:ABC transporter permease [Nocardioides sp. HM23]|uniref:MlaE family ABC transporter permease n=1 Tax=Nocardioides bizhenqiangii TaxID=3095076 RepID=UPI002ACA2616|nr:ABC transporter permease [Nocardioides sp. HM23]MDZ5620506.1 ABC transporter permease [Nocardioides sp. HM23]
MTAITLGGRAVLDNLYGRTKAGIKTTGDLVILSAESVRFIATDILARRFSWPEFLLQCWFMTRVSLLPTILVSIPFGVITSVQIGAAANQIGAQSFIGAVNGIGILRQGAPLVTSLMIAGAVGSAICSDLGARTVREETDALMVMGISPVQRLVAPRVLAALLISMLLTVIVAMSAMITAFALVVGTGQISSGTYLDSFVGLAQPTDLYLAELKALIFGFIAVIVASHKGLQARAGPKAVADAVNQAVVLSVILLAVVNVGITQAYVMLVPQGMV